MTMPDARHTQPETLPVTSSAAPHFEEKQESFYRDVLERLNQANVPYAVAGAFALQQHTGIWRCTKDLDIFLPVEEIPLALAALEKGKYLCEVRDPVWLAKAHREEYFVDLITGMSNGVIIVDQGWMDRAQPALVVGIPTRVIAAEELVASKLFVTRRERFDGADIAHIIYGTRGQLEWARLLELAGDHWELLLWALVLFGYVYPAQAQYVPWWLWQNLLTRFMAGVAKPDPKAIFRGSLIDENMFAIDTQEWGLADILKEQRALRAAIESGPAQRTGTAAPASFITRKRA